MIAGTWARFPLRGLGQTLALALMPALAGCGDGGEDFTVRIKRPAAAVIAPLSAINIGEAKAIFPTMRVDRSRPSDLEVLYTIPSSAGSPSTIRLRFEPIESGAQTVVHATVDVPEMRVNFNGGLKQLSETKVERSIRQFIAETGRSLEAGSGGSGDSEKLSLLLTSIAIVTNEPFLRKAFEIRDDAASGSAILAALDPDAFGGDAVRGENVPENISQPMDNPEQAGAADESARSRTDWREEEAQEKAAEPMDDAATE